MQPYGSNLKKPKSWGVSEQLSYIVHGLDKLLSSIADMTELLDLAIARA